MPIHVTEHAINRWCERIGNMPRDDIRAEIMAHQSAIDAAIRFGAACVRLGNGAGLVLADGKVVTVLAKRQMHVGRLQ